MIYYGVHDDYVYDREHAQASQNVDPKNSRPNIAKVFPSKSVNSQHPVNNQVKFRHRLITRPRHCEIVIRPLNKQNFDQLKFVIIPFKEVMERNANYMHRKCFAELI